MRMLTSASFAIALAGLASAQVVPGAFAPDEIDDYEWPMGRPEIVSLFEGSVPVIASPVKHVHQVQGDWFDFRTGQAVQARSGYRFGAQLGFGGFALDFTGVGGISGFSGWACAAGAGVDVIEFFDMTGAPLTGTFVKTGGFGAMGIMEEFSFVSPVAIGRVLLSGPETAFDDIAFRAADALPCYADCDQSGELDFFDFLCFQNEFAAQSLYADCDESGMHDFFDFLCFQNAFAAGCE